MKNSYIHKKCDKNVYFLLVLYTSLNLKTYRYSTYSAEELLSELRWYHGTALLQTLTHYLHKRRWYP
jgi:hypothetical protein